MANKPSRSFAIPIVPTLSRADGPDGAAEVVTSRNGKHSDYSASQEANSPDKPLTDRGEPIKNS